MKSHKVQVVCIDYVHLNNTSFPQSCVFSLLCEQHASAVVGLRLFVHGGFDDKFLDDLYVLDTLFLTWTKLSATGHLPSPRYKHTLNNVNEKLYLFGGSSGTHQFDSIHVLDLSTKIWVQLTMSGRIPEVN